MRPVSVDGVEELVGCARLKARRVGPRFFAQTGVLLDNLLTSGVVIRKVWKEGVPYVLTLGSWLGCRLGRRGIIIVGFVVVVVALRGRCCRRRRSRRRCRDRPVGCGSRGIIAVGKGGWVNRPPVESVAVACYDGK
jgi:hypothetical protein